MNLTSNAKSTKHKRHPDRRSTLAQSIRRSHNLNLNIEPRPSRTNGAFDIETDVIYQSIRLYRQAIRLGAIVAQKYFSLNMFSDVSKTLRCLVCLASYAHDVQECISLYLMMAITEYCRGHFRKAVRLCNAVLQGCKKYTYEQIQCETLLLLAKCQIKLLDFEDSMRILKLALVLAYR